MSDTLISKNSISHINDALQDFFERSVATGFLGTLQKYDQPRLTSEIMPFHDIIMDLAAQEKAMIPVDATTLDAAGECFDKLVALQQSIRESGALDTEEESPEKEDAWKAIAAVRPVSQLLKAHVEKHREPSLGVAADQEST